MKKYLLIAVSVLMTACASTHKANFIEYKIEKVSQVSGNSVIGVNDDNNMVYHRKFNMSEELRDLQIKAYELEYDLYGGPHGTIGKIGVLKECKENLAMLSDGKLEWTEPKDKVIAQDQYTVIGVDDKKIIGFSEEFLKDRIERFQSYIKILTERTDKMDDKISACHAELKFKRRAVASQ